MGLPFSRRLPSPAFGWSLLSRSAGVPDVSVQVAAAAATAPARAGPAFCLMLVHYRVRPTPRQVSSSSGSGEVPPRPSDCEPGAARSPASRPGCGSGARGTFLAHGREESNPHLPVLETGALPVELHPRAVLELSRNAKSRSGEGWSPGSDDLENSASAGAARCVPVHDCTYMGDSSPLGSRGPLASNEGSQPSIDPGWAASSARVALRLVAAWIRRMLTGFSPSGLRSSRSTTVADREERVEVTTARGLTGFCREVDAEDVDPVPGSWLRQCRPVNGGRRRCSARRRGRRYDARSRAMR